MKKLFVLISVLLASVSGYAGEGGTVGNGGDAVVCKNSVELLDIYEARALRKYALDLGDANLSVQEKIDLAVARLARVDPFRAAIVAWNAHSFERQARFISGITLRDIDDSAEIFIPAGCEKKQIAIQNVKFVFLDPYYTIDKDLWDQLDNDNKAALILHEVIFLASEDWTSSLVRYFNSIAFSSFIDKMQSKAYYLTLWGTHLKDTMNAGVGKDGRWYYQLPDLSNDEIHFLKPIRWTTSQAKKDWTETCRKEYNGQPILESDLENVLYVIKEKFAWDGNQPHSERLIFARNTQGSDAVHLLREDGRIRRVDDIFGEMWCVGPKFPLPLKL